MKRSGDWIPKENLIAANVFAGISWPALGWLAATGAEPGSLRSLGWVHLVALGWLTVASLSVLLHVVAAFLGVKWIAQDVARWALHLLVIGVVILSAGFFIPDPSHIEGGAILVLAALCMYLVPTSLTIGRALRLGPKERAVGRAFLITLSVLFVVAVLGTAFGLALRGRFDGQVLIALPKAHAVLGIAGWLSLLVFGVSIRTMRAIAGVTTRVPFVHIASSGLLLLGAIAYSIAMALASPGLAIAGGGLLCCGALLYALDLFDILRRREHPNPAAQLFVATSDFWLVACVAIGAGTLAGHPWGAALTFLALIGWLGQMVNGHVLHIGIRLMITAIRGDDDETRPWRIVNAPLALASWVLFQVAVALGTAALLAANDRTLLLVAALSGTAGWLLMTAAIALAYSRLQHYTALRAT